MQTISKKFFPESDVISCKEYGNGLINDTFIIKLKKPDFNKYIVQRLNTDIFKIPEHVSENIMRVTNHIRQKTKALGQDDGRLTLTLVPAADGKLFYKDGSGNVYRVFEYIDNSFSYDKLSCAGDMYTAGSSFGHFLALLSDFDSKTLHETIPNFHNTAMRYKALVGSVAHTDKEKLETACRELKFITDRAGDTEIVVRMLREGKLPLRVTHNDTKLNNILFDCETKKALCVVDLDTAMPGSVLYDFGDAIRTGAVTGAEDEKDLSEVRLDVRYFEAFSRGFIEKLGHCLTDTEKSMLVFGAKLLTLESAIRFLTDYFNGNVYFKTSYEEHNLVRCRTQIKLVSEIESKERELIKIVEDLSRRSI